MFFANSHLTTNIDIKQTTQSIVIIASYRLKAKIFLRGIQSLVSTTL